LKSRRMTNPHKGHTGLDRLKRATSHSIAGLRAAYDESAFRQEFWLAVVLLPLSGVVFAWALRRTKITGTLTHM